MLHVIFIPVDSLFLYYLAFSYQSITIFCSTGSVTNPNQCGEYFGQTSLGLYFLCHPILHLHWKVKALNEKFTDECQDKWW